MTKNTIDAIENARADKSPDYLQRAVVELTEELDATRRHEADTVESMSRDLIERREEISRLREELATTEGALTLGREALQCSVDDYNAIKVVNAKLAALLGKYSRGKALLVEDVDALLAEIKGGG